MLLFPRPLHHPLEGGVNRHADRVQVRGADAEREEVVRRHRQPLIHLLRLPQQVQEHGEHLPELRANGVSVAAFVGKRAVCLLLASPHDRSRLLLLLVVVAPFLGAGLGPVLHRRLALVPVLLVPVSLRSLRRQSLHPLRPRQQHLAKARAKLLASRSPLGLLPELPHDLSVLFGLHCHLEHAGAGQLPQLGPGLIHLGGPLIANRPLEASNDHLAQDLNVLRARPVSDVAHPEPD
mmetsp:Transcript_10376/g.24355  ORF Transcript_10376/g.24355 Transcript_10376/m.24355 type:complete len:236 (+) Transcript_10376:2430-3137(+)